MNLSLGRRGIAVAIGVAACLVLASVALAASTVRNPTFNLKALSGSISADGSSTVGPYTQAAAELGLSEQWVRRLAADGRLAGHRVGRVWAIDAATVAALAVERTTANDREAREAGLAGDS